MAPARKNRSRRARKNTRGLLETTGNLSKAIGGAKKPFTDSQITAITSSPKSSYYTTSKCDNSWLEHVNMLY